MASRKYIRHQVQKSNSIVVMTEDEHGNLAVQLFGSRYEPKAPPVYAGSDKQKANDSFRTLVNNGGSTKE